MQQIQDQQDSKTRPIVRHIEQIKLYLRSGDYSRALDLLRAATAEFSNDRDDSNAELAELEKLAQDGVKRSAEANRLITESQELFAHQNSAEAIRLLRKAYELDKNNSLARAILANALVEHAQSVVDTDWLEAETLTNQALNLNPAHPTAKTILSLIVAKKETSSVEDWVSKARKLQSSGDLFAALAWVAEGLAVHPHNPKLLQIQDEIQRDQDARRRQARRGDLEEIRRMEREIVGATDVASKQALAARIQTVAAKHWTDGEILSIANALLLRLGLVSQENSSASPRGKGATLILHVPRPSAPKPSVAATTQAPPIPVSTGKTSAAVPPNVAPPSIAAPNVAPHNVAPTNIAATSMVAPSVVPPSKVAPSKLSGSVAPPAKVPTTSPAPQLASAPPPAVTVPVVTPFAAAPKFTPTQPQQPARSNSVKLILVSAAVIILIAATFFFTRRHYAPPIANTPSAPSIGSKPTVSATAVSAPAPTTSEPSQPDSRTSSDAAAGKVAVNDRPLNDLSVDTQPPAESAHNLGTLLVVTGQDDARVFLNGKLQRQLTRAGQLRLPNLEPKDYVVQVSKSGFQDLPQQKIRIRDGEQAKLVFNLQPQPSLASLTIQGGAPGTTVFVDQTQVGTIQPDGTLTISTVNPGDHTVELRRDKDRFKPRQFKKHFVVGGVISLTAADAALEAASGVLKITFAPANATVAVVKGELLKMVSSGVPLDLPAGTYTLTARTAERFTRSSTVEVIAGQSKILDLSLAPNGMSKWDDPGAWKHEHDHDKEKDKDTFIRTGGDFVLYGVVPPSGTLVFSAMPTKGHLLQWVFNYTDPKNYILLQMDENNFYRSVIRNGQKRDQIIVPDKGDKKSFRTLQIRVTPTEIIHQVKHGDNWTVLDRWTQPGTNLSLGKFGLYIPGTDQIALSGFAHYADLNTR